MWCKINDDKFIEFKHLGTKDNVSCNYQNISDIFVPIINYPPSSSRALWFNCTDYKYNQPSYYVAVALRVSFICIVLLISTTNCLSCKCPIHHKPLLLTYIYILYIHHTPHACKRMHTRTRAHAHAHTHTHARTHAHTHTHTHTVFVVLSLVFTARVHTSLCSV